MDLGKNPLGNLYIFISIIYHHKAKNRTYRKNAKKDLDLLE